jgi:hypothetical protein
MKEIIFTLDGVEHIYLLPEEVTAEQVKEALDGIGGRPNDRG